ncbi:MAG TPA: zf-TFIIB domain-containing protein [Candidatus Binatia bacterium]|nr:zf-TFIIB domain-containing protein [Candidatus Binatia bacterium]
MKDGTDPLDETMRLLERVRQGLYFAGRDRELIEKFKAGLKKVGSSATKDKSRHCPNCNTGMEGYSFLGFVLDRCQSCGGIWMDQRELEAILRKATRSHLASVIERFIAGKEGITEVDSKHETNN